jgi:hypothetical protein
MNGVQIALVIFLFVVLATLIGVGVWWFGFRTPSSTPSTPPSTTPPNGGSDNGSGSNDGGTVSTNPEVYAVSGGPGYIHGFNATLAAQKCQSLNGDLATGSQIQQAQAAGANWCSYGWQKDGGKVSYPINSKGTSPDCGSKAQVYAQPGGAGSFGVNCYGIKPDKTSSQATDATNPILPFNQDKWSQYSS